MNLFKSFWVLLFILSSDVAQANLELRDAVSRVARHVIEVTDGEKITIGVIAPTMADSNSGPGIEELLKTAILKASPGCLSDDARYVVTGKYGYFNSKTIALRGQQVVRLTCTITDGQTGEDLVESKVDMELKTPQAIAHVMQIAGALPPEPKFSPPDLPPHEDVQRKHLATIKKNSESVVVGNTVKSSAASPYRVELMVKDNVHATGKALHPTIGKHGQPFVEIRKGQLYEIKLYNDDSQPVAANVSIDGISVFTFSDEKQKNGHPQFSHYILQPHSSTMISGWFHRVQGPDNYSSFLVTDYGKGALSKAGGARGTVGIIHIQFSHGTPIPAGEKAKNGAETGFGPPKTVAVKPVRFSVDPAHEFVTIRYLR